MFKFLTFLLVAGALCVSWEEALTKMLNENERQLKQSVLDYLAHLLNLAKKTDNDRRVFHLMRSMFSCDAETYIQYGCRCNETDKFPENPYEQIPFFVFTSVTYLNIAKVETKKKFDKEEVFGSLTRSMYVWQMTSRTGKTFDCEVKHKFEYDEDSVLKLTVLDVTCDNCTFARGSECPFVPPVQSVLN